MLIFFYACAAVILCALHLGWGFWMGAHFQKRSESENADLVPVVAQMTQERRELMAQVRSLREQSRIHFEVCERLASSTDPTIIMGARSVAGACTAIHSRLETSSKGLVAASPQQTRSAKPSLVNRIPPGTTSKVESGELTPDVGRVHYDRWQYAAVFTEEVLPDPKEFILVHCHDLAAGGFSYFSDELPAYDRLVIALGQQPRLRFFECRVVHTRSAFMHSEVGYLVGCAFVRKLENVYTWDGVEGCISNAGGEPLTSSGSTLPTAETPVLAGLSE